MLYLLFMRKLKILQLIVSIVFFILLSCSLVTSVLYAAGVHVDTIISQVLNFVHATSFATLLLIILIAGLKAAKRWMAMVALVSGIVYSVLILVEKILWIVVYTLLETPGSNMEHCILFIDIVSVVSIFTLIANVITVTFYAINHRSNKFVFICSIVYLVSSIGCFIGYLLIPYLIHDNDLMQPLLAVVGIVGAMCIPLFVISTFSVYKRAEEQYTTIA
jgi:hypothetical protein